MSGTSTRAQFTVLFLFWALVAVFVFTLLTMLISALRDLLPDAILWQAGALFVLGTLLVFRTARTPLDRRLRQFLILTGGSAVALVLCFLLHNFMYALETLAGNLRVLGYLLSALEIVSFLAAIFLFPLTFAIGAIGVVVLLLHSRQPPRHPSQGGLTPAH